MKKRIISLILVIATVFLTLTGCAFRYDKKDMTKYVSFDEKAFYNALHALVIADGSFAPTSDRNSKVHDTLAQELLKYAEQTQKTEGKVGLYDALYFCYYAMDKEGNMLYTDKFDPTKPTNIQLGLTTLEGLYKAIETKVLTLDDIKDYFYTTSSTETVKEGDVVSVSYFKSWDADNNAETGTEGKEKSEVVWHEYVTVKSTDFTQKLIGVKPGVEQRFNFTETVTNDETETTTTYDYSNVKVEHIVKAAEKKTVEDGDSVFVSYTLKFDAEPFTNPDTGAVELPETFNGLPYNRTIAGGKVTITVAYDLVEVDADAVGVADDAKTFLGQLVGKEINSTTNSIIEKNVEFGGKTVDFEYSNVKVHWTVDDGNPIEIKLERKTGETDEDKQTAKNVYGKDVKFNTDDLTYYVFPVYYIDVVDALSENKDVDAAAEFILTTLTNGGTVTESNVVSTVFDALNDAGYVTVKVVDEDGKTVVEAGKAITTLINGDGQLASICSEYKTKKTALGNALTALKTAQTNLAGATSETQESLKTALGNAEDSYRAAYTQEQTASALMNTKIKEVLACAKDGEKIAKAIVENYRQNKYDALDEAYRTEIKNNLSTEITKIIKESIVFNGKLPKKSVRSAYDILMSTYKQNFYEGNYTTGTSSSNSSASTETNYAHYHGDFNAYLIDKVAPGQDIKTAKAAVRLEAEKSVQDIILVYALTQMVEKGWNTELLLTKEEKKNVEDNLENQALQMQMLYLQYYGVNYKPEYDVEDGYHAAQLDKVINFLLATTEGESNGVKVDVYTNICYTVK